MSVLRTVYSNEGIDQKTIRTVVPFDKSRISVIVRELLEMGLLMDTASGRSSSLHLTAKGREVVSKTPQFKQRLREELFSPFSKEEMEEMRELFAKLNSHLDTVIQKYCGDNTD